MLNDKLKELHKNLETWHSKLGDASSPEKAVEIAKDVRREIERAKDNWRDDISSPLEKVLEHLEHAESARKLIKN